MIEATLRLFNAIQITHKGSFSFGTLFDQTIPQGYVLTTEVAAIATPELLRTISGIIGISGEKANSSFHKSWNKVHDAHYGQLVIEQIIHYFTTYGLESMGLFSSDTVYIPAEALDIPSIKLEGLRLTVVKGLSKDEILEKILGLCDGVALSEQTLDDIIAIEKVNQYKFALLERGRMKNRELKARLYKMYDLVPDDPEDFLRFVVNDITDESLLIKNKYLISRILALTGVTSQRRLDDLFSKAPKNLASIFYRYKPLFLALKKKCKNKRVFNRLRKDAVKQHVPLKPAYLSTVTSRVKHGLGVDELYKHLSTETVFRKARLAQALSYRSNPGEAIVYRVRNGKGFATSFSFHNTKEARKALDIVLKSIVDGMKVSGQNFYIPSSFEIALPATEKQFIGNFPIGSYIRTSDDLIVGVHWTNIKSDRKSGYGGYGDGGRVDLDLAGISLGGKIGWDGMYRGFSGDSGILFSGDMTDAPLPKGASELLYFKNRNTPSQLISVNYYNHAEGCPVPTSIIVAESKKGGFGTSSSSSRGNYMIDPNNLLANAKIIVTEKQTVLGLVSHTKTESRFYFVNTVLGNSRSSRETEHVLQARQFMMDSLDKLITIKDILLLSGAKVFRTRPSDADLGGAIAYTDLSPEALEKGTIIKLLNG